MSNDPAGGNLALTNLLGLAEPPTAIVCSTDQLAIGVLHGASNRELRVPGALSVTGFDDLQVSEFTVPALTTVRMPVAEMASGGPDRGRRCRRGQQGDTGDAEA